MLNNQGEFNDTLKEPFLFSSSLNLYTLFLCPTEGFFNFLISDFSFDLLNIPKVTFLLDSFKSVISNSVIHKLFMTL